ncbi:MAG: UbiX family flavin prenyltransferase [Firmicutes bacterium]|nr:UbiX family flavin prenyltransferase [Bacillota bacterium]
MNRLVVALSGASGAVYGKRLVEVLHAAGVEVHLLISRMAEKTLVYECDTPPDSLRRLAAKAYALNELEAAISSGSFRTDGMVVIPCSMKTLAAVAHGYSENLIARAADVTLKERRPLVMVVRETPLNAIHLENMLSLHRAGAIIMPAMPSFYIRPRTIDDLVNHLVGKVLDMFGFEHQLFESWKGIPEGGSKA